jgi:tetratricopeptide (TPR) repeat protein
MQIGEYKQARRSFTKALAAFEELDDRFMVASLLNFIAQTWLVEDCHTKALECVERARRVARETGHKPNEAGAWMILGEMARMMRDWDEAKRCYAAAAKLYEETDNRSVHVTRFNLALAEVGARNFEAAMELFGELEHRYPEVGLSSRLPLVYVGKMACAAGVADWQGFSRFHASTVEAVEKYESGHDDIAWMAKEAITLAREHGNRIAERRATEVACELLERLGKDEQAVRLRASLG